MATDAVQQFGNVSLNSWSALMQGALKIHTGGFIWQKKGGDRKVVEVPSTDIKRVELARVRVMTVWAEEKLVGVFSEFGGRTEDYRIAWCAREQVCRGHLVCIRLRTGTAVNFYGFRQPDIDTIYKFVTDTLGKEVQKREVCASLSSVASLALKGVVMQRNGARELYRCAGVRIWQELGRVQN